MLKKELNIDNIVEFFNSLDYDVTYFDRVGSNPNRFGLIDYRKVTMSIVEYFFDSYTYIKDISKGGWFIAPSFLNKNKTNKFIKNVSRINFKLMYPNIIVNLVESGDLKFNVVEYTDIYKFMVRNIDLIINHPKTKESTPFVLRSIINMLFHCSVNKHGGLIIIDNVNKVKDYYCGNHTSLSLIDNVISTNIDELYFLDDGKKTVENKIKNLGLPYSIEDDNIIYYFGKGRYVLSDSESIRYSRSRFIESVSFQPEVQQIMDEMKHILRGHKVDKLINRLVTTELVTT